MGRGSSKVGGGGKYVGFTFKSVSGRTMEVVKTSSGVTLVNGQKSNMNFETLKKAAKGKSTYKPMTQEALKKKRKKRQEESKIDYELGTGKGGLGVRGRGKSVYRPRKKK